MKKRYGQGIKIIYKDTDSLIYDIQIEYIHKDIKKIKDYFDTFDYQRDHELFSQDKNKVIGKFRDKLKGNVLMEPMHLDQNVIHIKR